MNDSGDIRNAPEGTTAGPTNGPTRGLRVYLAGPINGCDDIETFAWRQEAMRGLAVRRCWPISPTRRGYRRMGRPTLGQSRRVVESDLDDGRPTPTS